MGYKHGLYQKDLYHIMAWGKHKGLSLQEIAILDPQYIYWLRDKKFMKMAEDVINLAKQVEEPKTPDF